MKVKSNQGQAYERTYPHLCDHFAGMLYVDQEGHHRQNYTSPREQKMEPDSQVISSPER